MTTPKMKSAVYRMARKIRPVLPYGILANLRQWFQGDAHEPDFKVFDWLAEARGLVLDVGASRGQSALSVLRRARRIRVFSVEPNYKHRWSLLLIGLLHPFRYRFRMVAAGDEFTHKTLFVPGKRASGLSAQGSLDPAEFEKDYVHQRLAASGFDASNRAAYRQLSVSVIPLDSLERRPALIKLDVEGFEHLALFGLEKTLKRYSPALLIEINNTERWIPFLHSLGYGFYRYDESGGCLRPFDGAHAPLNIFCLHQGNEDPVTRSLLGNVRI
jgi:FkbM family methyltransferase